MARKYSSGSRRPIGERRRPVAGRALAPSPPCQRTWPLCAITSRNPYAGVPRGVGAGGGHGTRTPHVGAAREFGVEQVEVGGVQAAEGVVEHVAPLVAHRQERQRVDEVGHRHLVQQQLLVLVVDRLRLLLVDGEAPIVVQVVDARLPLGVGLLLQRVPEVEVALRLPHVAAPLGPVVGAQRGGGHVPVVGAGQHLHQLLEVDRAHVAGDADLLQLVGEDVHDVHPDVVLGADVNVELDVVAVGILHQPLGVGTDADLGQQLARAVGVVVEALPDRLVEVGVGAGEEVQRRLGQSAVHLAGDAVAVEHRAHCLAERGLAEPAIDQRIHGVGVLVERHEG